MTDELPDYSEHGGGAGFRRSFADAVQEHNRGRFRGPKPEAHQAQAADPSALAWERRAVEAETQLEEARDEVLNTLLFDPAQDPAAVAERIFRETPVGDERREIAITSWAEEDPEAAQTFVQRGLAESTRAESEALLAEAETIVTEAVRRFNRKHGEAFGRAPDLKACMDVALQEAWQAPGAMHPDRIDATYEAAFERAVALYNAAAKTQGLHDWRQAFATEAVRHRGMHSEQARGVKPMPQVAGPTLEETLANVPDHPATRQAKREQNVARFREEFAATARGGLSTREAAAESPAVRAHYQRLKEQREERFRRVVG